MKELYWITVLGNISILATIVLVIVSLLWIIIGMGLVITCNGDDNENDRKKLNGLSKKLVLPTIISLLLSVFIPSTNELITIYGVGGAIDYVMENPSAKQLPDKCFKVLNKWADEKLANDSIK